MSAGRRQTDPNKWGKKWHRLLNPTQKCFWQFLCDHCDWAGVWDPDFELAAFKIGAEVTEDTIAAFGERVEKLENGKYWLNGFIEFQQPKGLNPDNRAHAPIFRSIEKNKVPISPLEGAGVGLAKGLAMPPCKVTSSNVMSCTVKEGGAGETQNQASEAWNPADYVAAFRAIRPEFANVPEWGITNALAGTEKQYWPGAFNAFAANMANTTPASKLPSIPANLFAGYLRGEAKGKWASTPQSVDMDALRRDFNTDQEPAECNA